MAAPPADAGRAKLHLLSCAVPASEQNPEKLKISCLPCAQHSLPSVLLSSVPGLLPWVVFLSPHFSPSPFLPFLLPFLPSAFPIWKVWLHDDRLLRPGAAWAPGQAKYIHSSWWCMFYPTSALQRKVPLHTWLHPILWDVWL